MSPKFVSKDNVWTAVPTGNNNQPARGEKLVDVPCPKIERPVEKIIMVSQDAVVEKKKG